MRGDLRVVLVPWLLSRALAVVAYGIARACADEVDDAPRFTGLVDGMFVWDAAYYRDIAESGYDAVVAGDGLRFWPGVPLLARVAGLPFGGRSDLGLLVVANLSAFVFAVLLYRLARRETGDDGVARRAVWLGLLAPWAGVLVLGYAEATLMAAAVAAFLALRSGRWGWAALAGIVAGLCRPVGVLLVLPAAIEVWRAGRPRGPGEWLGRAAAVAGPVVGTGAYLAWVGATYDDAAEPVRIQGESNLRGDLVDPFRALAGAAGDLLGGEHLGSGLHFLWALVFLALLGIVARRLPSSYAWYSGAILLVALSAENLDSLERYALSAFPLVLAAALVTARREVAVAVLVVSSGLFVAYTALWFLEISVP